MRSINGDRNGANFKKWSVLLVCTIRPKMTKIASRGSCLNCVLGGGGARVRMDVCMCALYGGSGVMRSAANSHVKMAKVSRRVPDTSVRGSRSYQSKPACLHRRGTREKSAILNINTPIFLTPPKEQVYLNELMEKKVGATGHFEIFFKKLLFLIAIHTKTGMLFGQHFDGEPPRNSNHVFLRQFENGFNKKIGMF